MKRFNDEIRANLLPLSLTERETDGSFKWHRWAHLPHSSQALCFSAFGSLRHETLTAARDSVICEFVQTGLPHASPTNLASTQSRFKNRDCKGFYGPGSSNLGGFCRLEQQDGKREPRHYWKLGRRYFRPEVFREQSLGEVCPLRDGSYQLMRNFLFAATLAERERKDFGVIAVCSRRKDRFLSAEIENFRTAVLTPHYSSFIALAHFESLIRLLAQTPAAQELATFLTNRIAQCLPMSEGR